MKRLLSLLLLLIAIAVSAKLPDKPSNYVTNPDHILSPAVESRLNRQLQALEDSTTAQIAVVVVNDIEGDDDIDTYATDLFTRWGIGRKVNSNGALMLVAKDRHEYRIRTGYGIESVITDADVSRIHRDIVVPHFKRDDYDGGVEGAVDAMCRLVADPAATHDVRASSDGDEEMSLGEFLMIWVSFGLVMLLIMVATLLIADSRYKKLPPPEHYLRLSKLRPMLLAGTLMGLGIPALAYIQLNSALKRVRNRPRNCPNCGNPMHKLDEETDNLYLTPSQDAEERLGSVDYDVWLCDNCGEMDVIPFVNKDVNYVVCPKCGARTAMLIADRVIVPPTTRRPGVGARIYACRNCGHQYEQRYTIPRQDSGGAGVAAGLAAGSILGGRGGGFSGGGGFGGFGGGMTGGGGGGGSW